MFVANPSFYTLRFYLDFRQSGEAVFLYNYSTVNSYPDLQLFKEIMDTLVSVTEVTKELNVMVNYYLVIC